MEKIIGDALLGRTSPTQSEARVTCNVAARYRITCRCGKVLDQKHVAVLENRGGQHIYTCCIACFEAVVRGLLVPSDPENLIAKAGGVVLVSTWDGVETFTGSQDS